MRYFLYDIKSVLNGDRIKRCNPVLLKDLDDRYVVERFIEEKSAFRSVYHDILVFSKVEFNENFEVENFGFKNVENDAIEQQVVSRIIKAAVIDNNILVGFNLSGFINNIILNKCYYHNIPANGFGNREGYFNYFTRSPKKCIDLMFSTMMREYVALTEVASVFDVDYDYDMLYPKYYDKSNIKEDERKELIKSSLHSLHVQSQIFLKYMFSIGSTKVQPSESIEKLNKYFISKELNKGIPIKETKQDNINKQEVVREITSVF